MSRSQIVPRESVGGSHKLLKWAGNEKVWLIQSFRQDFTIGSLEKKCGNKLEKCVILHHDP